MCKHSAWRNWAVDSVLTRKIRNVLAALTMLAATTSVAYADTSVPAGARVTQIASNQLFVQNAVIYKLDKGTSDCAAGSYIYYYSNNVETLKAMYATVLAAYLSGSPIIVHFPTTGSCVSDGLAIGAY